MNRAIFCEGDSGLDSMFFEFVTRASVAELATMMVSKNGGRLIFKKWRSRTFEEIDIEPRPTIIHHFSLFLLLMDPLD
jgi:hypothetical protein